MTRNPPNLTVTQRACVIAMAQSKTRGELAGELGLSTKTVEFNLIRAAAKLGISGNDYAGMCRYAIQQGWINADNKELT